MAGRGFDEFYATHYDDLARTLTVALADRPAAEEAAQEALTRALRRWRHVCTLDRPAAWLYVVAMNHVRDGWRRDRREPRWDAELETATADPSGGVTTALSVRDAITTLPARQREAVVLRYLADLSLADVADAMGCAIGTVKATLHQALRSLRVELEEEDDDAHG
jgi:RNA polymerase sigma-70 factor, ECF subfamily